MCLPVSLLVSYLCACVCLCVWGREPLLLIAHQGILRVILAFYTGLDRSQVPHMKIPLNAVIRLQPAAVTCANEVSHSVTQSVTG